MKIYFFLAVFLFNLCAFVSAEDQKKHYEGKGEVTSVDPLFGRLTVSHAVIPGFHAGPETDLAADPKLLKDIQKGDLIDFTIGEDKGNAQVETIVKTGVAEPEDNQNELGKAVQSVLVATGEAAKTITGPVPPANQVVSGAVGATTDSTGAVLDNTEGREVKTHF